MTYIFNEININNFMVVYDNYFDFSGQLMAFVLAGPTVVAPALPMASL